MIQINFNTACCLSDLYEYMTNSCQKARLNELNEWCENNVIINGYSLGFKDIVLADFPKLEQIVSCLDSIKSSSAKKWEPSRSELYVKTIYNKLDKKSLVEALDVSVCPYCNRGYLNRINDYSTYQIDHFFPQKEYPVLAVSFYNLVPCCYACNHKKREHRVSYSPHNPRYKCADELIEFDYWISDFDFFVNKNSIHVCIDADPIMRDNVRVFQLREMYDFHKAEIQEIVRKGQIYPEDYVDDLLNHYKGLFGTKAEANHMVYGYYTDEDGYRKESLGKMKADIGRNIMRWV